MQVQRLLLAAFGRAKWPELDRSLVQVLHSHGLASFTYAALARQDALSQVNRSIRDELRASVMANLHYDQRRAAPLADALKVLASAAIPAVAYKGLDYAHRLYADPSERPMGDHDLIVPAARYSEAIERLEGIGYRSALVQSGVAALSGHYAAQLVRDGHQLDLHRSVRQQPRARVDYDAVIARSQLGSLRATPVRWLDPRDRLLLHVYHQAAHEFSVPLITFVDLELMLPCDRVALERARVYGIERPLRFALALRDRLFGYVPRARVPRILPGVEEIVEQRKPTRAVQLARKAWLFDSPRHLARFAVYALSALR
jgi:hypothetical protein